MLSNNQLLLFWCLVRMLVWIRSRKMQWPNRCLFISWFKGQSLNPEIKDNDDLCNFNFIKECVQLTNKITTIISCIYHFKFNNHTASQELSSRMKNPLQISWIPEYINELINQDFCFYLILSRIKSVLLQKHCAGRCSSTLNGSSIIYAF